MDQNVQLDLFRGLTTQKFVGVYGEKWRKFISNKSTNHMQKFFKFITWRILVCTAQHVSGVLTPVIRSSTTAVAASGFFVGALW